MSARKDIKAAIVTAAKTASALVGTRVYIGRHNPTASTNFPEVYVWQLSEASDTITLSTKRTQQRNLIIAVDIWGKAATPSALEGAFDDDSDTLRAAILSSSTLGGKCNDINLTNTEYLYDGDEEQAFGCARLTFAVKYFSTEP